MADSLLLAERMLQFSKAVSQFCKSERVTMTTRPLLEQLLRSATSVGANYTEANNAASKADFKNKIFIAKKEAAESKYWLQLLETEVTNVVVCQQLAQECHYILMTLQKIINTMNKVTSKTVNAR